MDRLPIYRLDRPDVRAESLVDLAGRLFGIQQGYSLAESPGRITMRHRDQVVEQHLDGGGVWAADESRWFNPVLRPDLPDDEQAVALVRDLADARGLLPELRGDFRFGDPHVAGTHLAVLEQGRRSDHRLDVQVVLPITAGDLPVVGGGGDVTFALGGGGELIGYTGAWRTPVAAFDVAVVPQDESEETFRGLFRSAKGLELESVDSYLAYYAAPGFAVQEFLYPVYVHLSRARIGGTRIPVRAIMLPATTFGPALEVPPLAPPRPANARPGTRPAPERGAKRRRSYATVAPAAEPHLMTLATKPWEAGTSWIGMSGGLAGSQANAQGFVDEWAADGWHIDFNWGDGAAWESDWRRNDDQWVDNADFVFYTGHANGNGWVLSNPDDGFLSAAEVGAAPAAPGDLWGSSDLEWVVVAACGPLQDDIISTGGGDVLTRWDGAFDGLHQLLGYGAITFDNTEEGRRIASYCRSGMTVKDAWFRAAKEIQPSTNGANAPDGPTVWVGTMWVGRSGLDPIGDHAWSHGSVSADPTSPTFLACMWTVC